MARDAERNFDNLRVMALDCSDDALADVCKAENVSATPTIKTYRDNQTDFYGGVSSEQAFANLFYFTYGKCGPDRLDRCRDEDRHYISELKQLNTNEMIEKRDGLAEKMKERYQKYMDSLRKLQDKMQKLKESTQREINTYAFRISLIETMVNGTTTTPKDEL